VHKVPNFELIFWRYDLFNRDERHEQLLLSLPKTSFMLSVAQRVNNHDDGGTWSCTLNSFPCHHHHLSLFFKKLECWSVQVDKTMVQTMMLAEHPI